jgi:transposase
MSHTSPPSSSKDRSDPRLFECREEPEGATGQPQASAGGRPRLQRPERMQIAFQPFSLNELVPPDHEVRAVWDYVERLDLSPLYSAIRAVEGVPGRNPIDPKILLALWLYATLKGVGSARALDKLCREHVAYRWICGGVSVNHHTLSDFRVAHPALLDDMLTESVATLVNEGLVSLERTSQDGMRVQASAGTGSFRRKGTLEKHLAEAREQVERLKRELEEDPGKMSARQRAARERAAREREERLQRALQEREKLAQRREARKKGDGEEARASVTDPEAGRMKMGHGGICPAYNVQFSTANAGLVITGVAVTNVGSDAGEMAPMAQQHVERYGASPKETLTDGSFAVIDDIEKMERDYGTVVYTPVKEEEKKRAKGIDPFAPCPGDSDIIARWRKRMGTTAAQAIYKERAATAELANAHTRNRGLRQFLVRGLEKVRTVALWHAVAHNFKRRLTLRAALVAGTQ